MINYSNVRGEVSDLLRLAEIEWKLEKSKNLNVNLEYTNSNSVGVLAFALATICLHVPQARKRLLRMIELKQDLIATLHKKR
tara:strand:+ start:177 stop:422 length:246 start_codon:yes stop_codon:yes gene_type:complete